MGDARGHRAWGEDGHSGQRVALVRALDDDQWARTDDRIWLSITHRSALEVRGPLEPDFREEPRRHRGTAIAPVRRFAATAAWRPDQASFPV